MIRLSCLVALVTFSAYAACRTPVVAMDGGRGSLADMKLRQLEKELHELEKGWHQIAKADDLPPAPTDPLPKVDDEFEKKLEQLSPKEQSAALVRLFGSMREWMQAGELRSRAIQKRRLEYRRKHSELERKIEEARKHRDQPGEFQLII